jgi:hypothetical protein
VKRIGGTDIRRTEHNQPAMTNCGTQTLFGLHAFDLKPATSKIEFNVIYGGMEPALEKQNG